jgi:phage terminase large subunit-like protein
MTQAIILSTEQAVAKGWLTLAPDIQAQMGKASESWSPEQLDSAKWYLASLGRGYRTNRYLDACLPQVSPKGKFFLSLTQRDVLYGGGAAGGKALDLSTQIPTPTGFKKLIDVLPGSQVIGRDGKPCDVIAESDIEFRDGWKLIFDDGSTAICSDDHRWLTFDIHEMASLTRRDDEWRAARRKTRKSRVTGNKSELFTASLTARNQTVLRPPTSPPPTGTVRTTAEIVATIKVRGRTSHAIPVCDSVELPPKRLPLDPYLLGCWLGDGHSDSPSMTTMDVSIAEAFIEAGFVIGSISKKGKAGKARTFYFRGGLRAKLRRLSVLRNKHVPHRYLWASKEQRLALLQGLLDTDGTCGKSGKVQFCSTKKQLAESALTLAASLGMKPTIREKRAKLYGKDCGPYWSVSFTPTMPVFRLQRKLRRQLPVQRRVVKFRYLLDAKRIHCRPMKCLVVNSSDRLFLCGRSFLPTHNSTYLLAAAIQYADVPGYSALLIRRTFKELSKGANSLMTRARRWFAPLYPHIRWSAQESSWVFRNKGGDAYLTFGYMEDEGDEIQYQSLEYDFLGVDEVTHQREHQFRYLFSRLRRNAGSDVPPRARAGTNPGGPHDGGEWVKARYVTDEYLRASQDERFKDIRLWEKRSECGDCGGTGILHKKACVYCDGVGEAVRYFLPARMQDNPFIDEAEYRRSMADVPAIERKQLEDGDWDVVREGKVFRREWLRPWIRRGNSFLLRDPLDAESIGGDSPNRPYIHNRFIDNGETLTFMTADTAYTAKSWSDYTCITIWTMSLSTYDLILRHGWMQKVETPNIMEKIKELYFGSWDRERAADFNVRPAVCDFAMIEFKSSGISIVQEARVSGADGMTIIPYDPGDRDKLARANVARKRFESGQVWFPHGNPGWLGPLVRQLLEFDGIDDSKKDDFVDCVSMAVHYVTSEHNMQRQGSTEVVTDAIPGLQLQGMPLRGTGFGAGMNGLPSVRGW